LWLNHPPSSPTQAPEVSCVILVGAAIVQMLNPGTAKTFGEYAKKVFNPFILSQYKSATRSLKSMNQERCGKGVHRRVGPSVAAPGQWQNFLRVDENNN